MKDVFIVSDNIISPLGTTTAGNYIQLKNAISGIKRHDDKKISPVPFYASLLHDFHSQVNGTKFEQLLIASIADALKNSGIDSSNKNTLLIISSTKGNISLLETEEYSPQLKDRIALHSSAKIVADHFGFVHAPVVISNACISGLLAILTGMRLIRSGQYENVVVAGADVISKFVVSGFQSFQAISEGECKPFDAARDGINLGEGAATIILSINKNHSDDIKITGGAVSNDANHISGPSRTGEELFQAIKKAMQSAGVAAKDVDFISAHGTATVYNDEMEAKAITLADMQTVPVNSLKGFFGHTLGAAGLIESVVTIQSMKENIVLPSRGFEQLGVSNPLNITTTLQSKKLQHCLKTASGFGGCNAALIFSKQ
ncbi:MAG TPA: beta-ketoacyl synthase N-terminal-like domain-containing protein [Ferruginibacter sp.]|jgi:3-oxoacyl-[acyl-carrier-protein] synthase-1|nr:beta-ketoacyl synthase N-terminal-like domain-containing protein [Ferruginibacter sp.]